MTHYYKTIFNDNDNHVSAKVKSLHDAGCIKYILFILPSSPL